MAEAELKLLNAVELKIALSDTDAKLQKTLSIYLCPLLLKLGSEHAAPRNKVISICQHISKRIKSNPGIALPVDALLAQFLDARVSAFTKNFTLIYLDMAIRHLPSDKSTALLPKLVQGIPTHPIPHQKTLLHLILHILPQWTPPTEAEQQEQQRGEMGFEERPEDARWIAEKIKDLMLLTLAGFRVRHVNASRGSRETLSLTGRRRSGAGSGPMPGMFGSDAPPTGGTGEDAQIQDQEMVDADEDGTGMEEPVPTGPAHAYLSSPNLSAAAFEFLTNNNPSTIPPSTLTALKLASLRFLTSPAFTSEEKLPGIVVATQDGNHEISGMAEDAVKRMGLDWESKGVVGGLFQLWSGGDGPLPWPVAVKVLNLLSKSVRAANEVGSVVAVCQNVLNPANEIRLSPNVKHPKLVQATVGFIHWVARMARKETVEAIAGFSLERAESVVTTPLPQGGYLTPEQEGLRGLWWVLIGLIGKRCPEKIFARAGLVKVLFEALSTEPKNLRHSVEEAISLLIPILHNPPEPLASQLKTLLLEQMLRGQASARYTIVRTAISAFPMGDVRARWICVLGLVQGAGGGKGKADVAEEARKGLNPHWFRVVNTGFATVKKEKTLGGEVRERDPYTLPTFMRFMETVVSGIPTLKEVPEYQQGKLVMGVPVPIFEGVVQFARQLLVMEAVKKAGLKLAVDENWEVMLDNAIEVDGATRKAVGSLVTDLGNNGEDAKLRDYLDMLCKGLLSQDGLLATRCAGWILELLAVGGSAITADVRQLNIGGVKDLVFGNKPEMREVAAHITALLITGNGSAEELQAALKEYLEKVTKGTQEHAHGSILAIGYVVSRLSARGKLDVLPSELVQECVVTVFDVLRSSATNAPMLAGAVVEALAEIGSYVVLKDLETYTSGDVTVSRSDIVAQLVRVSKEAKDNSLKDKAIMALGRISVSFPQDAPEIETILGAIYAVHEAKQVELTMGSGDALSCVAGAWQSKALSTHLDIGDVQPPVVERTKLSERIVEQVLTELVTSPKPILRKASSLWLLSLVKFCGDMPAVQSALKRFHVAFSSFLGDRDEFVQETASKGLNMVYQAGDQALKDELVRSLVGSFTGEKKVQSEITQDTELFEPGVLRTGDGPGGNGSISTMKDVMSLASELNNPDLVYKFMNLANSSRAWQSRKGAAFGLGVLADTSLDEIFSQNPQQAAKLYSKLFTYRHDPNPGVAKTMGDIWKQVTKDVNTVVETYFDAILTEALRGLGEKAWRRREASCSALAELISGQPLAKIMPRIDEIWQSSFRAADDIKDSVRLAAMSLCKTLTNLIVRSADADNVSWTDANRVLTTAMPFLLGRFGLHSDAQEVQAFAIDTIIKLCKSSGPALKPFLSQLIDELLALMTALEPQAVNYLSFHAGKDYTQEQLDQARFQAVRSSPMMDAIDRCVDLLDEEIMGEAVKVILKNARSVGLPTKAGAAKVIVNLTLRKGELLRPHSNTVLKQVTQLLSDRSITVRKSYAATIGYVARLTDGEKTLALVNEQFQNFFEAEDEITHMTAGITLNAISSHASDKFNALASSILPNVFIAKQDLSEAASSPFKEAWEQNTGGQGAIRLYLKELTELISKYLEHPSWRVKQMAARALKEITETDIALPMETYLPLLIKAVAGRSWKGKETILDAFVNVVNKHKTYIKNKSGQQEEITNIVIREAKRNNADYKPFAIGALAKYVDANEVDLFVTIYEIVSPVLVKSPEAMDVDSEDLEAKPMRLVMQNNSIKALAAAIHPSVDTMLAEHLHTLVDILVANMKTSVWNVRIGISEAIKQICERLDSVTPTPAIDAALLQNLWDVLVQITSDRAYDSVRTAGVRASLAYLKLARKSEAWKTVRESVDKDLAKLKMEEPSTVVLAEWEKKASARHF
ncbi:ARM repeat-containing protein [Saitoella complicata NRRL Y-17804]|nr:ARM repeat-containing protein [Saitoella complicata NRRL Y-17804]ODQ51798.1 ARM repeat-containing protein [Saitoella complicata NRRL Y-17804]